MRTAARPPALLLALALATTLALTWLAAGSAQAAGYRYWSFWQSGPGPSWAYATQGPSTARPADGEVNGYRFAVSTGSADAARPRRAPDFAAVCDGTPRTDGTKRVAVVIDFGTAADAPDGSATPPEPRTACARVRQDATSADALAAVAGPLRYNSQALLCAIGGYPRTGCGEQVSDAGPGPDDDSSGSGSRSGTDGNSGKDGASENGGASGDGGGPSLGLAAGLAAVLGLGAAAVVQARRRR
ncbi:SCO2322 family protein [Streptomyces sp. NPDC051310]|uniref:SCO2322 family protein n=1 Tax=Streptomyces sp. NPDC051310 TaxID=3365649 RepID=UPI0037AFD714